MGYLSTLVIISKPESESEKIAHFEGVEIFIENQLGPEKLYSTIDRWTCTTSNNFQQLKIDSRQIFFSISKHLSMCRIPPSRVEWQNWNDYFCFPLWINSVLWNLLFLFCRQNHCSNADRKTNVKKDACRNNISKMCFFCLVLAVQRTFGKSYMQWIEKKQSH